MELRMTNFNIMGVQEKIRFLWGFTKKECLGEGRLPKKGEAWRVCRFKSRLAKKRGWYFWVWERVDTPMHTQQISLVLLIHFDCRRDGIKKKQFSLWVLVNLIERSACYEKKRDMVCCTCLWKKLKTHAS